MPSELTPQSIREVRFREKLRGYHPEDVDAFVAQVAFTVESLQRRLTEPAGGDASAAVGAVDAPAEASPVVDTDATPSAPSGAQTADLEESLRRTLVLAQRTADMAVQEAQEEAARLIGEAEAQRAEVLQEVEDLRTRTKAELEHELSGYRQRLYDEREALQRDVAALHAYVAQERERLRIYFSQQLDQLEGGVPSLEAPPQMEGPDREAVVVADVPGVPGQPVDVAAATGVGGTDAGEGTAPAGGDSADAPGDPNAPANDDDPFLAELRRAVNDNEPLGPREEDPELPPKDERDLDIFNDDDGGGRFLRRRR